MDDTILDAEKNNAAEVFLDAANAVAEACSFEILDARSNKKQETSPECCTKWHPAAAIAPHHVV